MIASGLMEEVEKFKLLGSLTGKNGWTNEDIHGRIGEATTALLEICGDCQEHQALTRQI